MKFGLGALLATAIVFGVLGWFVRDNSWCIPGTASCAIGNPFR